MITIEEFKAENIYDLHAISLATAHLGGDAAHLYDDPELVGHIYSAPYAALEPSLVLLAVDTQGVAGFVLGVSDTQSWEERLEEEWWPRLRERYSDPVSIPREEWTMDQLRAHMIHHPARAPAGISERFPAHLHLNLMPRIQGKGVGRQLFDAWLALLDPQESDGLHVGINRQNERATRFWTRTGFEALSTPEIPKGRTLWMGRGLSQQPTE